MTYFKAMLAGRFKKDAYLKDFSSFVRRYPVVLSTTYSIRNSMGYCFLFDLLIVDEASQVDLVSGSLALSVGRRATIVGDRRQLAPIVKASSKKTFLECVNSGSVPGDYDYLEQSLLSSISSIFKGAIPETLLREHYRSHPKIIGFCNTKFYDGKLIVHTSGDADGDVLSLNGSFCVRTHGVVILEILGLWLRIVGR
jgi:superfamily I DNA and/or RNA helicase